MNWLVNTLTSTLGRKLVTALTGLFMMLFLVVHLIGNIQLLKADGGESFNKYAQFMGHNPIIQTVSIANFGFILLHIVMTVLLTLQNKKARPISYAHDGMGKSSAWSSRNMGILGTVVLIFIVVHLQNFWYAMKFNVGLPPAVTYPGDLTAYKDLYTLTKVAFEELWLVGLYVISMAFLGLHLSHGFESVFQTLGLYHLKYNVLVKKIGMALCVLVPAGYAVIPIVSHFKLDYGFPILGGVLAVGLVLSVVYQPRNLTKVMVAGDA